ncbi:protein-tyrosine-phosphatase MKP1-like [Gastrolobium bilobum]|uniref:protein-tyrosine-phosphatase MKP1-like n=1 Tax=Gastrolobium bilobum TaxID=150636 RepID=UPI002AB00818|nr:protein-tyrosine-phosphatase MKP1-like [Gastrolobium bilobum]
MVLGEDDKDLASGAGGRGGGHRRTYSRSVSWTDRSPATRKPAANNKPRSLLPPLQPLSINKRSVEEWPSAGSDDLGIWPLPETPRGSVMGSDSGQPGKEFQFKREKLAFYDKECSRIAEHVYLGSDTVAKNHELLRQNGITHVLNCVGFVCPEYFKSDFVYKTLWLQDSPTEDITSILYDVFDYFEDVRQQGGRVLVHCCQGVSRSTSLVIAYIMWREGQSFEDAFQYVKNARGVTNPNMGFACQLLQCQKRVHAMPASPNSLVRMYRMAPHSPYDPLHLVPKMVDQPCAQALDSRGAFIVHVPSAIYVWIGKNCSSMMSCNARSAAIQVIRYEKAKGPILSIHEDEEPPEFWVALSNQQLLSGNCDKAEDKNDIVLLPSSDGMEIDAAVDMGIRSRKVDEYDLDFGIFHKALAGGFVPPFSLSNTGSETETCLPARENGWGRLRKKLASGIVKGLFTSSKCCDATSSKDESSVNMEEENQHSVVDPLSPSSNHLCGSPDSFECFVDNSSDKAKDYPEVMDHFVPIVDSPSLPPSPHQTSNSFPCFLSSSPKFSSKSPTLSPCSSDYASSFTFSPSSTNWSDLSFMSSQQPSPSSLESTEPFYVKDASISENSGLLHKEALSSSSEPFLANHTLVGANTNFPCKGSNPSIAERRGSNPPPRMLLTSVSESSQPHKIMVKSQSFSLPDLDDNLKKDVRCNQSDLENSGKWLTSDADNVSTEVESEITDRESM